MTAPIVLVTGATGRVGGAALRHLRGRVPLRAAARRPPAPEPGVEWVRFAFESPETFAPALSGVGAVFLMRPPQMARARDFAPFLDAAEAAGVRHVALLSVKGAERNPLLPHHRLERALRARRWQATMIRPSDFMQNLETVLREGLVERDEIAVPAGRGRSAFVDVEDVGEAVARVLSEPALAGRDATLTGPRALGFEEVARILGEARGRPVRYRPVGPLRFLRESRARGEARGLAAVMAALYTAQRLGLAAEVTPDLTALLGRPPTDLRAYAEHARDRFLPAGA